ncbi:Thymus-specific serine protease [Armadillidium vulgare]|nr:Thymus-specific serine protease [Armadillidium vulgare]
MRLSLWQYQRCTEFGLFPTTDSPNQPFGSILPISSYLEKCKYDFGVDEHVLQCGVERTNKMYGGKNPNVTRVVFINGSIDPLHRSGVLQDLNEEAPAIFINGTSHCADMSSPDQGTLSVNKCKNANSRFNRKMVDYFN